jgi:hypothetical protein
VDVEFSVLRHITNRIVATITCVRERWHHTGVGTGAETAYGIGAMRGTIKLYIPLAICV